MYSISQNEMTQNKFYLITFFIHQRYLTNQTVLLISQKWMNLTNFPVKGVNDLCFTLSEHFFSYIMARKLHFNEIMMKMSALY